jgi:hypothetical protein
MELGAARLAVIEEGVNTNKDSNTMIEKILYGCMYILLV